MSKSMTKYQLDHFRDKVKRQFNPMIQDQELLVKQFKTEATDKAVEKLSKKIGADTIIDKFAKAEKMLSEARATALTFFEKKKPKDQELDYKFTQRSSYRDELTLEDCKDQLYYDKVNLISLKNTTLANYMNGCSISLPYSNDDKPIGIMLNGITKNDEKLLGISAKVETVLSK